MGQSDGFGKTAGVHHVSGELRHRCKVFTRLRMAVAAPTASASHAAHPEAGSQVERSSPAGN